MTTKQDVTGTISKCSQNETCITSRPVTGKHTFSIGTSSTESCDGDENNKRARETLAPPSQIERALDSVLARWELALRPYQRDVVVALIQGRDVLSILPTDAGKSLPIQLISAIRDTLMLRTTLATMPLIALGHNQDKRAESIGLIAAQWHGKITGGVKREILDRLAANDIDVLFTTPESVRGTLGRKAAGLFGLAWIDEAHVAIAAKNYRTAWAEIGEIVSTVCPHNLYVCTARCRRREQEELIRRCGLNNPIIIRQSPHRDNLVYQHAERSIEAVIEIVRRHSDQRMIVYVATRRLAEGLANDLNVCGYLAGFYHGGMSGQSRAISQDKFASSAIKIMIATDAFGLGIDYRDIRAVVIFDPPSDVSAFVQQAGRAGRDGCEATIYICSHAAEDGWASRQFLADSTFPPLEHILHVWRQVKSAGEAGVTLRVLTRAVAPEIVSVRSAIHWLSETNLLVRKDGRVDRKEHLYVASGDFTNACWDDYLADKAESAENIAELQQLFTTKSEAIPAEIVRLFEC